MEKRRLGKSSIQITPLLLGTSAIGGWNWGGSNSDEDLRAIKASLDNGLTTIDTAPIYGLGASEELIGEAIKGRREEVVIASKCGLRWNSEEGCDPLVQKDLKGNDIITRKNSKPQSIIYECEQSLKRLAVDYIDLYQIHWFDSTIPFEESWSAMVELKKQGKVRAIGVCNYSLEQLCQAHAIYPVDSIQLPYSLINRGIEKSILPFCIANDIGAIVYSPMERGLLTGKISPKRIFPLSDQRLSLSLFSEVSRKRVNDALEKLRPLTQIHKATYAQIVINSTMNTRGITGTIVGARNESQAIENAKAANLQLTDLEMEYIKNLLA